MAIVKRKEFSYWDWREGTRMGRVWEIYKWKRGRELEFGRSFFLMAFVLIMMRKHVNWPIWESDKWVLKER